MRKQSGWGCWLWGIGIVVGTPLLLIVIGVLFFLGRERSARNQFNKRVEQLVAQGMPVDDATMLEFTNKRTSKENTRGWLAVFEQTESPEFKEWGKGVPTFDSQVTANFPAPGEKWPEPKAVSDETAAPAVEGEDVDLLSQLMLEGEQEPAISESHVREFLANWSELHDKIAALSLKQLQADAKGVQFITRFESFNTLLPCTQSLREAARLLNVRGQVALYDRDSKQVTHQIKALIGCSKTLQDEPVLISQLVTIAIESMAIELLKTGLAHDVFEEADLVELLPYFRNGVDIGPGWRLGIQGERAMALPVFENPALASPNTARIPARSRDALHFLDAMDRVLAIPDDDFDSFIAGLNAEEQKLEELTSGSIFTKLDTILTGLISPAYSAMGNAFVRRAMQNRMAVTCIGIRLYEKQNGRWPASLDDLKTLQAAEGTFDPVKLHPPGDQPFGYRVEDKQVIIWSGNPRLAPSTPPEPLPSTEGDANAEENKLFTWRMNASTK